MRKTTSPYKYICRLNQCKMFLYVCQRNTQLNYLSANVFVFLPRKFGWIYYFLPLKFCPFFAIYFLWKWAIMWKFSGPRGPWNCLLCVREPCPWLGKIKVMHMIRICNTFRVEYTGFFRSKCCKMYHFSQVHA